MRVLGYIITVEYAPRRFYLLHWAAWIIVLIGVIFVLIAHGHYTIDVLIAYHVTTRLFRTYHTLASNNFLLQSGNNNYIGREWWFTYFKYFEKNVRGPVPRQYEWPLPWPRNSHSKLPNRESYQYTKVCLLSKNCSKINYSKCIEISYSSKTNINTISHSCIHKNHNKTRISLMKNHLLLFS